MVGARGTGKTTIARALEKYWKNDDENLVTYIDVRNDPMMGVITQMLATSAERETQGMIQNEYGVGNITLTQRLLITISNRYKKLFPLFVNRNKNATLGQNFLKAIDLIYNPTNEFNGIFSEFSLLRDEIAVHFLRTHDAFPTSEEFINWVQSNWKKDTLVTDKILRATHSSLRVQHWVYLAKKILKIKKQIIWVDNIDALTSWQQSNIHSVLRILFSHVRKDASVLVSVREQNVYKNYDYTEFGASLFTRSIKLPIISVKDDTYESYDIVPATEIEISNILKKRLKFILYRSNKAREEGVKFNKQEVEKLLKLEAKIKKMLISRKGIFFTNGSVREFLKLNIEFMRYLLKDETQGGLTFDDPVFRYGIHEVTNLFMFFVRLYSWNITQYNIGEEYDLVNQSQNWSNENETNTGHSINHLILHAIWNLTLMNPGDVFQAHKCTTIESVQNVLGYLNYSPEIIKESIYKLYGGGSAAHSGLIEIQSKNSPHIEELDQLSGKDILNITMRGKVLVASIANTFSYTYASALALKHNLSGEVEPVSPPRKFLISTAISEIFPFLCDIAQMCIESLFRTRHETSFFSGNNWFRKYLLYFGVPITKTYSLKHQLSEGVFVRTRSRALQFHLILNSIITFSQYWRGHDPHKKPWEDRVIELRELFDSVLDDVKKGESIDSVNFRDYFDIEASA